MRDRVYMRRLVFRKTHLRSTIGGNKDKVSALRAVVFLVLISCIFACVYIYIILYVYAVQLKSTVQVEFEDHCLSQVLSVPVVVAARTHTRPPRRPGTVSTKHCRRPRMRRRLARRCYMCIIFSIAGDLVGPRDVAERGHSPRCR